MRIITKQYRAVLFDMDGTLLDSYEANAGTGKIIMERFGIAPLPGKPMRKFIGAPLEDTYGRWFRWEEGELERFIKEFRTLYEERKFLCAVYPGIFPLLEGLRQRGVKTAMATLKRHPYAQMLAERFGLARRLDWVQGRSPEDGIVTKADTVRAAMKQLGIENPEEAALVGDSSLDLEGAKDAGVDFIAVYYGFGFSHDPGDEAEETFCAARVETTEELAKLLLN